MFKHQIENQDKKYAEMREEKAMKQKPRVYYKRRKRYEINENPQQRNKEIV